MANIADGTITDFTSTIHRTAYPAISPTKPSLSQAGKTVLVTGGGTGIGKAIAHSFVLASAATVIIIGRRVSKLQEAAGELEAAGKQAGKTVKIMAKGCDVADDEQVKHLWDGLEKEGVHVDVLILNSGILSPAEPLFETGTAAVWTIFEVNVKGPLHFAERFHKQRFEGLAEKKVGVEFDCSRKIAYSC
jgi:NAD(P)-dependent dehydrogenase (short-subunit alcohol dehydrogenase family)